jgi:hypothetical protein
MARGKVLAARRREILRTDTRPRRTTLFGPLLFLAVAVLAVPAIWAGVADSCSEGAWLVPVLVSGCLAATAIFVFGLRWGHPVLGVIGALVGTSGP